MQYIWEGHRNKAKQEQSLENLLSDNQLENATEREFKEQKESRINQLQSQLEMINVNPVEQLQQLQMRSNTQNIVPNDTSSAQISSFNSRHLQDFSFENYHSFNEKSANGIQQIFFNNSNMTSKSGRQNYFFADKGDQSFCSNNNNNKHNGVSTKRNQFLQNFNASMHEIQDQQTIANANLRQNTTENVNLTKKNSQQLECLSENKPKASYRLKQFQLDAAKLIFDRITKLSLRSFEKIYEYSIQIRKKSIKQTKPSESSFNDSHNYKDQHYVLRNKTQEPLDSLDSNQLSVILINQNNSKKKFDSITNDSLSSQNFEHYLKAEKENISTGVTLEQAGPTHQQNQSSIKSRSIDGYQISFSNLDNPSFFNQLTMNSNKSSIHLRQDSLQFKQVQQQQQNQILSKTQSVQTLNCEQRSRQRNNFFNSQQRNTEVLGEKYNWKNLNHILDAVPVQQSDAQVSIVLSQISNDKENNKKEYQNGSAYLCKEISLFKRNTKTDAGSPKRNIESQVDPCLFHNDDRSRPKIQQDQKKQVPESYLDQIQVKDIGTSEFGNNNNNNCKRDKQKLSIENLNSGGNSFLKTDDFKITEFTNSIIENTSPNEEGSSRLDKNFKYNLTSEGNQFNAQLINNSINVNSPNYMSTNQNSFAVSEHSHLNSLRSEFQKQLDDFFVKTTKNGGQGVEEKPTIKDRIARFTYRMKSQENREIENQHQSVSIIQMQPGDRPAANVQNSTENLNGFFEFQIKPASQIMNEKSNKQISQRVNQSNRNSFNKNNQNPTPPQKEIPKLCNLVNITMSPVLKNPNIISTSQRNFNDNGKGYQEQKSFTPGKQIQQAHNNPQAQTQNNGDLNLETYFDQTVNSFECNMSMRESQNIEPNTELYQQIWDEFQEQIGSKDDETSCIQSSSQAHLYHKSTNNQNNETFFTNNENVQNNVNQSINQHNNTSSHNHPGKNQESMFSRNQADILRDCLQEVESHRENINENEVQNNKSLGSLIKSLSQQSCQQLNQQTDEYKMSQFGQKNENYPLKNHAAKVAEEYLRYYEMCYRLISILQPIYQREVSRGFGAIQAECELQKQDEEKLNLNAKIREILQKFVIRKDLVVKDLWFNKWKCFIISDQEQVRIKGIRMFGTLNKFFAIVTQTAFEQLQIKVSSNKIVKARLKFSLSFLLKQKARIEKQNLLHFFRRFKDACKHWQSPSVNQQASQHLQSSYIYSISEEDYDSGQQNFQIPLQFFDSKRSFTYKGDYNSKSSFKDDREESIAPTLNNFVDLLQIQVNKIFQQFVLVIQQDITLYQIAQFRGKFIYQVIKQRLGQQFFQRLIDINNNFRNKTGCLQKDQISIKYQKSLEQRAIFMYEQLDALQQTRQNTLLNSIQERLGENKMRLESMKLFLLITFSQLEGQERKLKQQVFSQLTGPPTQIQCYLSKQDLLYQIILQQNKKLLQTYLMDFQMRTLKLKFHDCYIKSGVQSLQLMVKILSEKRFNLLNHALQNLQKTQPSLPAKKPQLNLRIAEEKIIKLLFQNVQRIINSKQRVLMSTSFKKLFVNIKHQRKSSFVTLTKQNPNIAAGIFQILYTFNFKKNKMFQEAFSLISQANLKQITNQLQDTNQQDMELQMSNVCNMTKRGSIPDRKEKMGKIGQNLKNEMIVEKALKQFQAIYKRKNLYSAFLQIYGYQSQKFAVTLHYFHHQRNMLKSNRRESSDKSPKSNSMVSTSLHNLNTSKANQQIQHLIVNPENSVPQYISTLCKTPNHKISQTASLGNAHNTSGRNLHSVSLHSLYNHAVQNN